MAVPPIPPGAKANKPGDGQVESYERVTKTGQTVKVEAYDRNAGDAEKVQQRPGRTPVAAKPGTFPQNRAIPGVFPHLLKANKAAKAKKSEYAPIPTDDAPAVPLKPKE